MVNKLWLQHTATSWMDPNKRVSLSFKALRASLVAQMVKNLPAMQETLV